MLVRFNDVFNVRVLIEPTSHVGVVDREQVNACRIRNQQSLEFSVICGAGVVVGLTAGPIQQGVDVRIAILTGSWHALNVNMAKIIKQKIIEQKSSKLTLDIMQILKILPHRYPFLLVDKILEIREGRCAIGIKMSR